MSILNQQRRKQLLQSIKGEENNARKATSLKQSEIYNDRLFQYVKEELLRHFSSETVDEMPIVSFINFPRRIVNQEASIYKGDPERSFFRVSGELNEKQLERIEKNYKSMRADVKLKSANQKYKLQDQTHLMVLPLDGKLKIRSLYQHQVDAIPSARNPEVAEGYIISSFDKERYLDYQQSKSATGAGMRSQGNQSPGVNTPIADKEDYKESLEYYVYWDKQYNFVFNGRGEIIDPETREPLKEIKDEDVASPIPGIIPIIDISMDKDFEYFVRSGLAVSDFGTQYNAAMSDLWHIVRMQSYAIGVLIAPDGTLAENTRMGPNLFLNLKTNPNEGVNAGDIDFKFVSPNPDIQSSLSFLETMLMNFMASRGLDPKEIATDGGKSFNSALERMLAMIDEFEATKDDFKLFERIEMELFEIVKAWLNNASDQLDEEFHVELPDDTKVSVKFEEPQLVQTKSEKMKYWQDRIDNGLASRKDAIMDIEGIDSDRADQRIEEIDGQKVSQELTE